MEGKKYEFLIGEGASCLLPGADDEQFSYSVLENLEFSEVMYMMELCRKQTYRPLICIREMGEDE